MKIRYLHIDQFKKFIVPVGVEGFGNGLNVISGPNEMGKSTILEAIHAVLFERHKSKGSIIKSFQHAINDTAPTITLGFELGDQQYKIEKRFIKSPFARLTMPNKLVDGDEAEEELQKLLGFNPAGKTGSSSDTLGLWSVLWVRQGDSLESKLSAFACTTIQSCLENEVGILTGGVSGQTLLPAIETALNEIVDKRDKPRAAYKEVLEKLIDVESDLEKLQVRFVEIDSDLTLLAQRKQELQELQSQEIEAQIFNELSATKERHKAVSEIEANIALIEQTIKLQQNQLETKQKELDERIDLQKNWELAEQEALTASESIEKKIAHESNLARQVSILKEAITALEKSKSALEKERKFLRKMDDVISSQEKLQGLEENCRLAMASYQEHLALQEQADNIHIDAEKIQRLQAAEKAKERAQMALHACATTLTFDIQQEAQALLTVDEKPLASFTQPLQIVDETVIALKDIGSIRVMPGIVDKRTLTAALEKTESQLNALLEESEIETLEAAELALQKKKTLELQASSKLTESQIYVPGDPKQNLPVGAIALETYINTLQNDLQAQLKSLNVEELPSRDTVSHSLTRIDEDLDELDNSYQLKKQELTTLEDNWSQARDTLFHQKLTMQNAQKSAAQLKQQYETIEQENPLDSVQTTIADLTKEINIALKNFEQKKQECGGDTLELLEIRIKRFEDQLANRKDKVNQLNIDIVGLENRIQILEAEGLEETIAFQKAVEEKLQQEKMWYEREAKTLKLLQQVLSDAEMEAKERYLAPVVNKIKPHLQILFPKSTVEIDENFQITGIIRKSDTIESFEHLSSGTREQIAILVRLAFAEMLIEQGKPATLILDDALVFADDERLGLMFDILNLAAQKMQVIVFTCRQKVFESLGGKQIYLIEQ